MFLKPDKLYWVVMPPFLIGALILYFALPDGKKIYAFSAVIVFWVVYYGVRYYLLNQLRKRKSMSRD
ncbi:hypothetical protein EQV77_04595 [Halobacillus fulvus]|nr:hypothetical protein EQV77_04595 [Halobacillus fulvus]